MAAALTTQLEVLDGSIVSPDGLVVDPNDVDQLADELEAVKNTELRIKAYKHALVLAIVAKAPTDAATKTVRVRGKRRRVKIEMPDESWDQSQLKEAWNSYPQFRDEFLSIATLKVHLREWKKAINENGERDWTTFRRMVAEANRGVTGTPSVSVEE